MNETLTAPSPVGELHAGGGVVVDDGVVDGTALSVRDGDPLTRVPPGPTDDAPGPRLSRDPLPEAPAPVTEGRGPDDDGPGSSVPVSPPRPGEPLTPLGAPVSRCPLATGTATRVRVSRNSVASTVSARHGTANSTTSPAPTHTRVQATTADLEPTKLRTLSPRKPEPNHRPSSRSISLEKKSSGPLPAYQKQKANNSPKYGTGTPASLPSDIFLRAAKPPPMPRETPPEITERPALAPARRAHRARSAARRPVRSPPLAVVR